MEDYIDFPCSRTWLRWYNSIGLTPRASQEPSPAVQEDMVKEIRELRNEIRQLTQLLAELLTQQKPPAQHRGQAPRKNLSIMRVVNNDLSRS